MMVQSQPDNLDTDYVIATMPKVTAAEIKKRLAYHLIMTSGYHAVGTEIEKLNKPDIIGINKTGTITEFEIKVSRSDLVGELRTAQACMHGDPRGDDVDLSKCFKVTKHCTYHGFARPRPAYYANPVFDPMFEKEDYRPHRFVFVVPADLVPLALEMLEGSRYGVMESSYFRVVKRPIALHKEPLPWVAGTIAHSLSFAVWCR